MIQEKEPTEGGGDYHSETGSESVDAINQIVRVDDDDEGEHRDGVGDIDRNGIDAKDTAEVGNQHGRAGDGQDGDHNLGDQFLGGRDVDEIVRDTDEQQYDCTYHKQGVDVVPHQAGHDGAGEKEPGEDADATQGGNAFRVDLAVSIGLIHQVLADHHTNDDRNGIVGNPKSGNSG